MYDDRFRSVFHKIALSTCLMAAVLSGLSYVLQDWVHGDTLRKILAVGTMVGAAGITYFLAVLKSGVFNINDIKELLKRKKALPPAKTNLPPEV
jgi:succinate dehydrogenase hydrophobic anchor subunit